MHLHTVMRMLHLASIVLQFKVVAWNLSTTTFISQLY